MKGFNFEFYDTRLRPEAKNWLFAAVVDSSADSDSSNTQYLIDEGDTESFTLTVNTKAPVTGSYVLAMSAIGYYTDGAKQEKLQIYGTGNTNRTPYVVIDGVETVSKITYYIKNIVKVSTSNIDGGEKGMYTLYTIQLKNGKEIQVNKYPSNPKSYFEKALKSTGFSGSMSNFNKFIVDEPTGTIKKIKNTKKPKITGTARNTNLVGFSIDDDEGNQAYGSGEFKVNSRNRWAHRVKKDLPNGDYTLTLYTGDSVKLATKKFTITKGVKEEKEEEVDDTENDTAPSTQYVAAEITKISVGTVNASSSKVKVIVALENGKEFRFKISKTKSKKIAATRVLKVLKKEKYGFNFSMYSTDAKKINVLKRKVEFVQGDVLGVSISVNPYTQLGNALTSLNATLMQLKVMLK